MMETQMRGPDILSRYLASTTSGSAIDTVTFLSTAGGILFV